MIKINDLRSSNGSSISFDQLKNGFLSRISKKTSPKDLISSINTYGPAKNRRPLTPTQITIRDYLTNNFEAIILGLPSELENFIGTFNRNGWETEFYNVQANGQIVSTDFGNTILKTFGYESRFRSVKSKGIWLAEKLGIKSCPYCNAQYTLITKSNGKANKAKFQFDHFFPKKKYPYLSISLFNLIPSCANCNLSKGDRSLTLSDHYHPFHNSISDKFDFRIDNESLIKRLIDFFFFGLDLNISMVSSSSANKKFVDDHNKLYELDAIYENHKDVADDILMKSVIYNSGQKDELMNKIAGLFPDEATFNRYLIGTYPLKEEILKRPLTKFMQDIARQVNLIE